MRRAVPIALLLLSARARAVGQASPAATSFAVCDDALYSLRSNGVYEKSGSTWTQIRGASSAIACGK